MIRRTLIIFLATLSLGLSQIAYTQSTPLNSDQSSPAASVYSKVKDSIYTLFGATEKGQNETLGSAVAVSENLLATNCHVAVSGNVLKVEVNNKSKLGMLIYNKDDICIIEVPNANFSYVKIRPSELVKIGEDVFAIGNPEGFEKSISKGIISNIINENGRVDYLQTDAAISPGSSGGGLFDKDGNLIGITTLSYTPDKGRDENLNFALPTELILDFLQNNNQPNEPQQQFIPSSQALPSYNKLTSSTAQTDTNNKYSLIGSYGNDKVGLIKLDHGCAITMTGKDANQTSINLVIWSPKNPTVFYILPWTESITESVTILDAYLNEENPSLKESYSYLVLDKDLFPLYGETNIKDKYPILFGVTKDDPTTKLMDGDYFDIEFKTDSGLVTIKYGLYGFTEALAAYDSFCK